MERPRRGSTARRRGVTHQPRPTSGGRGSPPAGHPAMTHFTSDGGAPAALPALVSRPEAAATTRAPSLDRNRLHEAISVRRQRLAEREVDLVAACAKAVAHDAGRHIRLDDRTTWDRAAWNRYSGACDATRTRVHAGDAPPHQGHRAAGTTGHTPRAIPGVRSVSGCTAEREKWNDVRKRRLRTVACPLGSMRGLNRSPSRSPIPASPSRRARAPVMTGEAPSARAASVSLRSRAVRSARGPDGPDTGFR